jgi:hypothetical protein
MSCDNRGVNRPFGLFGNPNVLFRFRMSDRNGSECKRANNALLAAPVLPAAPPVPLWRRQMLAGRTTLRVVSPYVVHFSFLVSECYGIYLHPGSKNMKATIGSNWRLAGGPSSYPSYSCWCCRPQTPVCGGMEVGRAYTQRRGRGIWNCRRRQALCLRRPWIGLEGDGHGDGI